MLEAELFALFERTADAAYAVTDQGEICFWNGAAERLFGHAAEEVLHRSIDEVLEAHDPHAVRCADLGGRLHHCLR